MPNTSTEARKNLLTCKNKQFGMTGVKSKLEGGGRRQTSKGIWGQNVMGFEHLAKDSFEDNSGSKFRWVPVFS